MARSASDLDSETCRACLRHDQIMVPLFSDYNSYQMNCLLAECSGLVIDEHEDWLPAVLCSSCVDTIIAAYELKQMCLKTDALLRSQTFMSDTHYPTDSIQFTVDTTAFAAIAESDSTTENYEQNEIISFLDSFVDGTVQIETELNTEVYHGEETRSVTSNAGQSSSAISERDESATKQLDLKSLACEHCSKTFADTVSFRRHHNCLHKQKIKCPICSRTFAHISNLKRHLSTHPDQLFCRKCNSKFSQATTFYEHFKFHRNEDFYSTKSMLECDICHQCTSSRARFMKHMKEMHHIDRSRPFKCDICARRFSSKQGLCRHIENIHTNGHRSSCNRQKNFLCNTCGKTFHSNNHLSIHERSHTGERPFQCSFNGCTKSFSQPSGLKLHVYTHTGERPYVCQVCDKRFIQSGHLQEHVLTHTAVRPYECPVCHHLFRVKGNLNSHMTIHSGEQRFNCTKCDKQFAQNAKRKQHQAQCCGNTN